MELGIAGRRALVCGASKGLGYGCALALAREGVAVTLAARDAASLAAAAARIRQETGATVATVSADVATEDGRRRALEACAEPDILVTNAGGPPPGDFRSFAPADWQRALEANMLAPIELIRATIDPMIARRFGRVVNITSSAVKAPVALLGLSNGARAGLTGFVAGIARQVAEHGVTINNLLPGKFATDRLRANMTARAELAGRPFAEVWATHEQAIPARRYGTAEEFGRVCAFLCSIHAGYLVGQNILLDGGEYPGAH